MNIENATQPRPASNGVRVLQIGSDRSQRGDLVPGSVGTARQDAYARSFGALDDVSFSLRSDGFSAHSTGALSVYPTNSRSKLLYGLDAFRIARKLPRPDVVSAQDPFEAGLIAYFIARAFRVPLHVQAHTDLFDPDFAKHSPLNFLRVRIASFVLARADGIRVVSSRIRKSVEARVHPKRLAVLPIFVDIGKYGGAQSDTALTSRFSRFSTRVLFVGRLESEKDPCLALRSFAEVAKTHKSDLWSCLIFVGDGSERATLEKLAEELGVANRVFFEGERDAAPYYKVADLVLCTSRYEGYGLVIIEALASGKPVLSTDVGVAREVGAIVTSREAFAKSLGEWFREGPREAQLRGYPYRDFDEYVAAYTRGITALKK